MDSAREALVCLNGDECVIWFSLDMHLFDACACDSSGMSNVSLDVLPVKGPQGLALTVSSPEVPGTLLVSD